MKQLTSLDAQFLGLEDDRQFGHVASLAVYDPTTAPGGMTAATMKALVQDRLSLMPPLRWRLVDVPLGMDYPYWTDDERFDLDYHIRELALPAPGDDAQLADQVARLHSRPLDRTRPLWEMYVVAGLADGLVALYIKLHHALVDGMSGAELTGLLLDTTPHVEKVPFHAPDSRLRRPVRGEMLGRGVVGLAKYPARAVRAIPHAVPNLDETFVANIPGATGLGRASGRVVRVLRRDGREAPPSADPAPSTSFNGPISAHRRVAIGRIDLGRVKAVKSRYGVTVNDVVVTLCAGALRRWLLAHDELPEVPLVTQIPVSVRTSDEFGTYGNRILLLGAALHTDIADPEERLRATASALSGLKQRHQALPAALMSNVNHFVPPALFSLASRMILGYGASSVGRPTWNLVISNVPGPQAALYCAGAKMVANYPISVVLDGLGLNITVMSYNGALDIGIVADREQVPDVWTLIDGLDATLGELESVVTLTEEDRMGRRSTCGRGASESTR